jgi:hypothetical protein
MLQIALPQNVMSNIVQLDNKDLEAIAYASFIDHMARSDMTLAEAIDLDVHLTNETPSVCSNRYKTGKKLLQDWFVINPDCLCPEWNTDACFLSLRNNADPATVDLLHDYFMKTSNYFLKETIGKYGAVLYSLYIILPRYATKAGVQAFIKANKEVPAEILSLYPNVLAKYG